MKKVEIYPQITVYKFNPENYPLELGFAMNKNFRYNLSFFNKQEWYKKKRKTFTLEELKKFFATRKIICVLYSKEDNEANIVLEGK